VRAALLEPLGDHICPVNSHDLSCEAGRGY
jgi:hypothetical protein